MSESIWARWANMEGSTRPAALMRIALGLIVWVRFADEVAPFQALNGVLAVHGVGLLAFALLTTIGLFTRVALLGLAAFIAFGYFVLSAYGFPGWNHHHVYLLMVAAILLSLTPSERSYSLDRIRRGGQGSECGRLWAQNLIGLQLSAVYFWAAFDKTDVAFLSGQRLEQTFVWTYSGRFLEDILLWQPLLVAASVLVVAVEYFLAVAIHVRRWQALVLPIGVALHATFYLLLPVDTYSITMVVLYLSLLDPEAVHRFIDRMQGHEPTARRL